MTIYIFYVNTYLATFPHDWTSLNILNLFDRILPKASVQKGKDIFMGGGINFHKFYGLCNILFYIYENVLCIKQKDIWLSSGYSVVKLFPFVSNW